MAQKIKKGLKNGVCFCWKTTAGDTQTFLRCKMLQVAISASAAASLWLSGCSRSSSVPYCCRETVKASSCRAFNLEHLPSHDLLSTFGPFCPLSKKWLQFSVPWNTLFEPPFERKETVPIFTDMMAATHAVEIAAELRPLQSAIFQLGLDPTLGPH